MFQLCLLFRLTSLFEQISCESLIKCEDISDITDRFFGSSKCFFVILLLWIKSTEPQTVVSKHIFHLKALDGQLNLLVLVGRCYWILNRLNVAFEVKDHSFNVSQTLLKHPKLMVGGSNIVKDADDQVSLNCFAAPRRIL